MAKDPEITMDLPRWWAGQPTQTFEVVDGNGDLVHIQAHEAMVGTPQPTLSFVRYEIREVDVVVTTGGRQNKEEEEDIIEHPIMVYAGGFNAGAWISFRDVDVSEVVSEDDTEG
jgi:hypothetical protein